MQQSTMLRIRQPPRFGQFKKRLPILPQAPEPRPRTFDLFSKLADELQVEIWKKTMQPRFLQLCYGGGQPIPACLMVHSKSRAEGLRFYRRFQFLAEHDGSYELENEIHGEPEEGRQDLEGFFYTDIGVRNMMEFVQINPVPVGVIQCEIFINYDIDILHFPGTLPLPLVLGGNGDDLSKVAWLRPAWSQSLKKISIGLKEFVELALPSFIRHGQENSPIYLMLRVMFPELQELIVMVEEAGERCDVECLVEVPRRAVSDWLLIYAKWTVRQRVTRGLLEGLDVIFMKRA